MNDPRKHGTSTPEATQMAESPGATDRELVEAIARAKTSIEEGDLEGGLQAFREIAHANPEIPEVFNNLGAICAAMGRREEAEEAFSHALELTPDNANPWYNRGLMRFQGGNNVGALDDFRRAHELDPADPEVQNNLGVVHFQLRRWDEARAAFEASLELRPDYAAARLNLIDVLLAEGRFDDAHTACRQLVSELDHPEAHAKLLECAVAAATAWLDQAVEDAARAGETVRSRPELAETLGRSVRAAQVLRGQEPSETPTPIPDDPVEESLLG